MAETLTIEHICVRCEQTFFIGTKDTCPRAPDRGEHEARDVHWFKSGRLDGLCAQEVWPGLMCGHRADEEQIHAG